MFSRTPSRIALWFCLVFGLGSPLVSGSNPAGQSQFLATVAENGLASTLSRVFLGPLQTQEVATVPGSSSHLVVCGGVAYWAVANANSTTLYRSRNDDDGVQTLSTITGQSAFLETDGVVIYWCVKSPTGFAVWRVSGGENAFNYAGGVSGIPRFLVVDNQDAYVGSDRLEGQPQLAAVHRFRIGDSNQPPLLNVANSQIKGMVVDEGHLWTMVLTSQEEVFDRVSVRRLPVGMSSASTQIVQQIEGQAGQLVARDGRAIWSIKPTEAPFFFLFGSSTDITNFSMFGNGPSTSDGIHLNGPFGLWWGSESGGVRAMTFDAVSKQFASNTFYPSRTVFDAVKLGDDICLGLQDGSDSMIAKFEAYANGLWPTHVIQQPSPLLALEAGAWHLFYFFNNQLLAEDEVGISESHPVHGVSKVQIATGTSGSNHFVFAANQLSGDRTLFGVANPSQALWEGNDAIVDPMEGYHWNNRFWLNAGASDLKALYSLRPWNGTFMSHFPEHPDPKNIREFKGRLIFDQGSTNPEEQIAVSRSWDQSVEYLGDDTLQSLGGEKDNSRGWLLFTLALDPSGFFGLSLAGSMQFFWHPTPAATTPEVTTWGNWKGSFVYEYRLPNGNRLLASQRLGNNTYSAAILEVNDIHEHALSQGGYVFIATVDGSQRIYRISRPDSPATELLNLAALGFTDPRNLHAHGDSVFVVVDHEGAEKLLEIHENSFQEVPSPPGGVQKLINYGGSILAFPSEESLIFRRQGTGWISLDGPAISEADDFTEALGGLFFSAKTSDGRFLHRVVGMSHTQIPIAPLETRMGLNPRPLVLHQDRLIFAGNTPEGGRQLLSYEPGKPPFNQIAPIAMIGSLDHLANPIIDGPRNIQSSTATLLENLPAGFLVGNLTAEGIIDSEDITYEIDEYWSGDQFAISGSELLLNRPTGSSLTGPYNVRILATNMRGISNTKELEFSIINNQLAWITENFPDDSEDPLVTGDDRDPDADGIKNILERAIGLNPNQFYRAGDAFFPPQLEIATQELNPADQRLELRFRTPLAFPSGIGYEVQASGNLGGWDVVGALWIDSQGEVHWTGSPDSVDMTIDLTGGWREFRVRDSLSLTPSITRRFLRLKTVEY